MAEFREQVLSNLMFTGIIGHFGTIESWRETTTAPSPRFTRRRAQRTVAVSTALP